jgi:signal transduction histidine kinase/DNA-binding response OmpR family regulator
VTLLLAVLAGLAHYVSTREIHVHITSRIAAAIGIFVILIILVVLPVYSVIVTREIRKRRRVEEALVTAKEEAERANELKDRFLSMMSHELRTPLNAVLGFSALLADARYGALTEQQKRFVSHVNSGGKHLLKLISDILDLSKIEAGRMELLTEELSVALTLEEVVSALRPLAEKKSQTLSVQAEPSLGVHADPTRLKQILMNLVGNAIKFTPEGGLIEVLAQQIDHEVQVKVRDNGPGIPREEQRRIFDAFYPLRKPGEGTEGTGLGLAITESLVNLHGGSLNLESEVGRGSCFYFRLPISASVKGPRTQLGRSAQNADEAPSILIIEDDPTTVHLIKAQLISAGYNVFSCEQSQEALKMAAELQPDAITLDLLMKYTSGWELLLQLKNDFRTAGIPVIVVTVIDHPTSGAALGAEEYLVKPVDKATLLGAVERCLQGRGRVSAARPILVVEDDTPTREIIIELLRTRGYSVTTAVDGAAAREYVSASLPSLVILDLMLPKVNGFELLAEWRANARTVELPVFVLTNKDFTAKEKKYLSAQTQSLFHKQATWQEALLKQLKRVVGKPKAVRS